MRKLVLIPILAVAVVTGGCFKLSSESTINNDGSMAVKLAMTHKAEILEMIKAQIDQAIEMVGEDNPQITKARDQFAKIGAAFDEKNAAAEWKKLGLEVSKSSSTDKDGWKGFEIEGSAKNVAEYNKKQEASRKAAESRASDPMSGGPDPSAFSVPRMPRFYKTDQPNVAKVVLAWRDPSKQDAMFEQEKLDDDQKEKLEMGLDQARTMMDLDSLKIEMKYKLPGKILSVSNCKQEGDHTLVFSLLGTGLTADSMPQLMKLPTATIQIDPKEFKIPLEDEPKAESRPASRKVEKPAKDEEEKKNKDEDKEKDK
jgi:hypothetical protein